MKYALIVLTLLFSKGDIPLQTWRSTTTTVDSRVGVTFEASYYFQYEARLRIKTTLTFPDGSKLLRIQLVEPGLPQSFTIRYTNGTIKKGLVVQETLHESNIRRTIRTRVYVGTRLAKDTTHTEYNLAIGVF